MHWLGLDLDGTLITCRHRQVAVLQAACPRPMRVDTSLLWEAKRHGATTKEALREQGMSMVEAEGIVARWLQMVEEPYWLGLDTLFEDVLEELAGLKTRAIRIALLTARQRSYALGQQLKHLGLAKYLDTICVVSPQRAVEEKARVLAELTPIAMIGDTESDAAASELAKTPFVAVETGQRSSSFLRRHGVQNCYPTFHQAVASLIIG